MRRYLISENVDNSGWPLSSISSMSSISSISSTSSTSSISSMSSTSPICSTSCLIYKFILRYYISSTGFMGSIGSI